MNKLSGITTLAALNESIVMKDDKNPELVGKTFGGRYVKVKVEKHGADGKTKEVEVKVSVNEIVNKMRSLSKKELKTGSLIDTEIDAGKKLCEKIVHLQGQEVAGENPLQWLGTRIAQLSNLFSNKKAKILNYQEAFDNQASRLSSSSAANTTAADNTPRILTAQQRQINQNLERLKIAVLNRDMEAVAPMIKNNPNLVSDRNEHGDTILHILASSMIDNFNEADHPQMITYLIAKGANLDAINDQGKMPSDIIRENLIERTELESDDVLTASFLPKVEFLDLDLDDVAQGDQNVQTSSSNSAQPATISLDQVETRLRTIGNGAIADAMVLLGKDFMGAAQRMQNSSKITQFNVYGDLQTGVTLKMKLDKPIKIEADLLIKQLNKLHPGALNYFLRKLVDKLVSGGILIMDQEMTIKTHRDGDAIVMTFGDGLYVEKGSDQTAVKSIHFTLDRQKGVMLEFDKSSFSTPRTLAGVRKSLEEGTGAAADKKTKTKADHRVQWSKMVNLA